MTDLAETRALVERLRSICKEIHHALGETTP